MRKFKLFDFWINIGLIIASIVVTILAEAGTFIFCYFIVGGWQVISMTVHYSKRWFIAESVDRRLFHQFIIGTFFIMLFGSCIAFLTNSLLFLLILLILLCIASPILAITYTCICYNETFIKMRRPLSLLK